MASQKDIKKAMAQFLTDSVVSVAKSHKMNNESKKVLDVIKKDPNFSTKMKRQEKVLDKAWKEYISTVRGVLESADGKKHNFTKERIDADIKYGWGNRGRELEFKLFLLSGNIENFDPTDNLPGFVAGDLVVEIPIGDEMQIVQGQIKYPGGKFDIPDADKAQIEEVRLQKEFDKVMDRFATDTFNKSRYQEAFRKRFQNLVSKKKLQVQGILINDLTKVKFNDQRNKKAYTKAYMAQYFATSAADYYLLGFKGPMSDFVVSIPKKKANLFVEEYTDRFKPGFTSGKLATIRWQPKNSLKENFTQFLTTGSPSASYHLHSLYGQAHFSRGRAKAWRQKTRENSIKHRDFLRQSKSDFEIPHRAFFGSDYSPINY